MNNLNNLFGLNIMPWRPPLDVLDEKIRPALKKFKHVPHFETEKFRIYRTRCGGVYAELQGSMPVPPKSGKEQPRVPARRVIRFTENWGALLIQNVSFDELFKAPEAAAPLDMHEELYAAARKWWQSKRPVGWNLRQHLQDPCINCVSSSEDALASAIARVEFAAYYKRVGNVFSC